MATKRTRRSRNARHIITEAVVAAFNGDEVMELHGLLGLHPWNESPLEVDGPTPPEWMKDSMKRADWASAWAWREAIVAAGGRADLYHDHEAWMVRRLWREYGEADAWSYIAAQEASTRRRLKQVAEGGIYAD